VLRLMPRLADSDELDRFDFAVRERIPAAGLDGLRGLAGGLAEELERLAALEEWRGFSLTPPEWARRFRDLRKLFRTALDGGTDHRSLWSVKSLRGEIVTRDGRKLGEHQGVHHFTVGQRKGLGIATGEPLYVIATDAASQRVVVGGNDDLLRKQFRACEVNWISIARPDQPVRAQVKIRNKHIPADATLHAHGDTHVDVVFDEPQRAVTPGQGAVFFDSGLVLGGGWIE
jgi:hypothetical protein